VYGGMGDYSCVSVEEGGQDIHNGALKKKNLCNGLNTTRTDERDERGLLRVPGRNLVRTRGSRGISHIGWENRIREGE